MIRCVAVLCVIAGCYRDAPARVPPPPRAEVTVERPGFQWVHGHWQASGDDYRWRPGYYVRVRPDYVFVEGQWERRGDRRVWVDGRWRKRGDVVIR